MKNLYIYKSVMVFAFAVVCSISIASCSSAADTSSLVTTQNDPGDAIENTLKAYFDEVRGGGVTDTDYASELFAGSNPFADLLFQDEQSRTALQTGLTQVTYDLISTDTDTKEESAECEITVSAPDVARIKADLRESEGGVYYDSFIMAIHDKDVPRKEFDIGLILSYDANNEEWMIKDFSEFAEIMGTPYTQLVFDFKYSGAEDTVDSLMAALAKGDTAAVDALCSELDSSDFFPENERERLVAQAIYSRAVYIEESEPQGTEEQVGMVISLTLPDMDANYIEAYNDADMVSESLKSAILDTLQSDAGDGASDAFRLAFYTAMAEKMKSADALLITYDVSFSLAFDAVSGTWHVTSAQTERLLRQAISGYDPLYDITEQHLQIAIEKAAAELCAEGVIDLVQQGDINNYFLDVLIPPQGDPFSNIQVSGWTDPETGSPAQSYDSAKDAALMYVVLMSSDWGDCTGHIEWYSQNASVLLYEEDFSFTAGSQGVFAVYPPEEDPHIGWLSKDIYKVIIYLSDGSILAESSIGVS